MLNNSNKRNCDWSQQPVYYRLSRARLHETTITQDQYISGEGTQYKYDTHQFLTKIYRNFQNIHIYNFFLSCILFRKLSFYQIYNHIIQSSHLIQQTIHWKRNERVLNARIWGSLPLPELFLGLWIINVSLGQTQLLVCVRILKPVQQL